jgi:hypothetical protein
MSESTFNRILNDETDETENHVGLKLYLLKIYNISYNVVFLISILVGGYCLLMLLGMISTIVVHNGSYNMTSGCKYNTSFEGNAEKCQNGEEPLACAPNNNGRFFIVCPLAYGMSVVSVLMLLTMGGILITNYSKNGNIYRNTSYFAYLGNE